MPEEAWLEALEDFFLAFKSVHYCWWRLRQDKRMPPVGACATYWLGELGQAT